MLPVPLCYCPQAGPALCACSVTQSTYIATRFGGGGQHHPQGRQHHRLKTPPFDGICVVRACPQSRACLSLFPCV